MSGENYWASNLLRMVRDTLPYHQILTGRDDDRKIVTNRWNVAPEKRTPYARKVITD